VVQHDRFNRSAIQTTVVVAITSNLRLAAMPGNVRLRKGEANLPRPSVVNVTQLRTVDRDRLTESVGHLAPGRIREVLDGLALVLGLDV
jgi:mRNA interferase MazF